MPVFSDAEFQEFDSVVRQSAEDAKRGKRPQISAVLLSIQFATTLPNENGKMWFEDKMNALLIIMSIRKLMDENTPEMFSIGEKAFMFAILNTGRLLAAIDSAGMDIGGFNVDGNGNRVDDESNPDDEGEDWKGQ
jgi:hypothetical protein